MRREPPGSPSVVVRFGAGFVTLSTVLLLAACGQKGPLSLPKAQTAAPAGSASGASR